MIARKGTAMTARMTFRPESCRAAAGRPARSWRPAGSRNGSGGRTTPSGNRNRRRLPTASAGSTARGRCRGVSPRSRPSSKASAPTASTSPCCSGWGAPASRRRCSGRFFGAADGFLDLAVLDSTDPGAVLARAERLDLKRSLFIVSTKSGGNGRDLLLHEVFLQPRCGDARGGRGGKALSRDHRSRERPGGSRRRAPFPPRLPQRPGNRRPLFGPLLLRPRPGGTARDGCRATVRAGRCGSRM